MLQSFFAPNILFYLLILTTAFIVTYGVGKILCSFVPALQTNNAIEKTFNYLITGFIITVSIFAIITTRGDSVFLLSAFVIAFYFLNREKSDYKSKLTFSKSELITLVSVFALFLGLFAFSYYLFFIRGGGNLFEDFMFYANVSKVLTASHIESTSLFVDQVLPNMYHYGELWFNSLWANIFTANHLHVLVLVTNSYLCSLIILAAISLVQHYLKNKLFIAIFGATTLLIFNPIITFLVSYQLPIATHPKFFSIAIFTLFAVLQYVKGERYLSFCILLLLIPFNSLLTPGILSGLFFFAIIHNIRENGFTFNTFVNKYTISPLVILLFFILFYGLRIYLSNNYFDSKPIRGDEFIYSFEAIARGLFYTIVRVIPAILALWFLQRRKSQNLTLYFDMIIAGTIGGLFSAVIGGLFSNYHIDGQQISTNYNGVVIGIIIFTCLLFLLSKTEIRIVWLISITLLIINSFVFSTDIYIKSNTSQSEIEFYKKLQSRFKQNKPINFGYIRNYDFEQNINTPYTRIRMIMPLKKIAHILPDGYYAPYCLSALEIPENTLPKFNEKKDSYLWKYAENKKKDKPRINKEQTINTFISIKKINYIVVEKQAELPRFIENAKIIAEFDGNKVYLINE